MGQEMAQLSCFSISHDATIKVLPERKSSPHSTGQDPLPSSVSGSWQVAVPQLLAVGWTLRTLPGSPLHEGQHMRRAQEHTSKAEVRLL